MKGLWLAPETNEALSNLRRVITEAQISAHSDDPNALIDQGKNAYRTIAELRDKLEEATRKDILSLHKFGSIVKRSSKSKQTDQFITLLKKR